VVNIASIVALKVRWAFESLLPPASSTIVLSVRYQYLWTEMIDESVIFGIQMLKQTRV